MARPRNQRDDHVRTFQSGVTLIPGATEATPAPEGTLPDAPMGDHGFGSDGRDAVLPAGPHVTPVGIRHGAFAHHAGKVEEGFSIAYNGQVIEMRAGQKIEADDGLRDAIVAARGPVAWQD